MRLFLVHVLDVRTEYDDLNWLLEIKKGLDYGRSLGI